MKPTKSILRFVNEALRASPAYRAFVKEKLGKIPWRVTPRSFCDLPITTKNDFSQRYAPEELLMHGDRGEVAYASSGSSGKISVWFRDEQSLVGGTDLHEYLFEHVYGIKRGEPTLVLVTFSMGLWVAGLFTADACRALRKRGFAVTIATPGIDKIEGLAVLARLAPLFKHVVIAGYPPFVLDFLREAFHNPAEVPPSVFLLTSGDKFSEEWREEVAGLIGHPTAYSRIIGVYGSADAGAMAFETPFTIALRRAARTNASLAEQLFPDASRLGGLYQFLPDLMYVEEHGGELLITKRMPIPLVRYNIHDRGGVYTPESLADLVDGGRLGRAGTPAPTRFDYGPD